MTRKATKEEVYWILKTSPKLLESAIGNSLIHLHFPWASIAGGPYLKVAVNPEEAHTIPPAVTVQYRGELLEVDLLVEQQLIRRKE